MMMTVAENSWCLNVTGNFTSRQRPFNDLDIILSTTFIIIFLIFGLIANLLTIAVIATSNKLRSIFHFFIFSMCISDATSAFISWINLYRRTWGFDNSMLPDFLCKFYWAVDMWTSYSTALHVLSFAILRLISLRFSSLLNSANNSSYHIRLIWIPTIWVVTFFCGALPFGLISGNTPKDRNSSKVYAKWPYCTQLPSWFDIYEKYIKFAYPIFFYFPLVFTLFLSSFMIGLILRSRKKMKLHLSQISAKRRQAQDKRAVVQLVLIVVSFIIGYVPFTAFEFFTVQVENCSYATWWIDWHFGTAQYMFLRLSECLNPVFYNIGSVTMRNETKKFLRKTCPCLLPDSVLISSSRSATLSGFSTSKRSTRY